MGQKDELSPRKQPRQRRSRATVDAIVEAAARVFAEQGYAGGSTNRIAETAGVGIGSLYEYFPNKASILVAVAERHIDQMMADVDEALATAEAQGPSLEALVRGFVLAMLEVHERDPELNHVVFAEAPHPPELHACVLQMEEKLAHRVEALLRASREVALDDPDTAAHLVVQTTEALTHRYAHQGIHDLSRERFVEEAVLLLTRYLVGDSPSHSPNTVART
jgi:AcrR family transcriptional regulator